MNCTEPALNCTSSDSYCSSSYSFSHDLGNSGQDSHGSESYYEDYSWIESPKPTKIHLDHCPLNPLYQSRKEMKRRKQESQGLESSESCLEHEKPLMGSTSTTPDVEEDSPEEIELKCICPKGVFDENEGYIRAKVEAMLIYLGLLVLMIYVAIKDIQFNRALATNNDATNDE
ncbi:hypothetical protein BGZ46_007953 [Entomortierella lignicola]|nr:hypothetical protein BGZ46_007953 [Entomortierella lignicola]